MKRVILILSAVLLWTSGLMAQTGELSGKVMDKEYNDILPFASINLMRKVILSTGPE